MMRLGDEKVFNFIIFLNLILGLWIPFGRMNFKSHSKKKLCKFVELFFLAIFTSTLLIIVSVDLKLNFSTNSITYFVKLIFHTTGYISVVCKSIVLLRIKHRLLDLIRNLNYIISHPIFKQLQTGTLVKVSRFAGNALLFQIGLFLSIQAAAFALATSSAEYKEFAQKTFTNVTDDKIEKALGVNKWDSTIRFFVAYSSIVASIRPLKSIAIDSLIFYFFTFVALQTCILEKSLHLACQAERGEKKIIGRNALFTCGVGAENSLNITAWKKFHRQITEYVESANNAFTPIILLVVITSTTAICAQIFSAVMFASASVIPILALYSIWVAVQVFCYCIIGQNLINAGESLCKVIYRTSWMEINPNLIPLMHMTSTDTRHTFCIKAGPFMVLSYEFFIQFIGVVITYLLILLQFKG